MNDHIIATARRSGEASLQAYERLLRIVADAQEAAGDSRCRVDAGLHRGRARGSRELADALPTPARSAVERAGGLVDKAAQQARRVLSRVKAVEGEVWGAVAREQDLPIATTTSSPPARFVALRAGRAGGLQRRPA